MTDQLQLRPLEGQSQANEADPSRMLHILWRGKWILLGVPLLALAGAKVWLDRQIPLYSATAQVQVDSRELNPMKSGAGEAINKPRTVLKQQQALIRSTTILKRMAESPALKELKTFSPERLGDKTLVGAIYDGLGANIDVESDRLYVSFFSPIREDTLVVVDEALRVYIEYHKEKKREQAEGLADIVRREWESTTAELDAASAAISALQSKNTLLVGTEHTPLQQKLDNARQASDAAHKDTQHLRAAYEDMLAASKDPALFHERWLYWRTKAPIQTFEERLKTAEDTRKSKEGERDRMLRSVGTENARLAQLRDEIDALKKQEDDIAREYAQQSLLNCKVDYDHAQAFEQILAADEQVLLSQVAAANEVLDQIKDLGVKRDELRAQVANFAERITQLELENQTGAFNLDVVEYARAGVRPIYPETEKTLIYALGGSAIVAFGLVLLVGLADRRVRNVEDIPRLVGTSVLGVLPRVNGDRVVVGRIVEEEPLSLAAEAFRSVRAATAFALPASRGIVLITSAATGEGKSVCASNIAYALARAGKRTLLVDADMRKPVQHEIYEVENGVGLAGLLSTSAPLKKSIVSEVAFGLDLLTAGDARGKSAELCEGAVLGQLLQSLRETYDCIVIDAPPVLETSEARVLARLADAVVLVLRLEATKAPSLKRAAGILRGGGARILGCLPNGAASQRGARAYAGGISFGNPQPGAQQVSSQAEAGSGEPKVGARGTDFLGLEEESA